MLLARCPGDQLLLLVFWGFGIFAVGSLCWILCDKLERWQRRRRPS
jgi:hypothetical protein